MYQLDSNASFSEMQEKFIFAHFFFPNSNEGRFRLALLNFPDPDEQIELVRRKNVPLEEILSKKSAKVLSETKK